MAGGHSPGRAPASAGWDRPRSVSVAAMRTLVLSIIGDDRAGLVEALADVVVDHGGTWDRSQMTAMAGVFAGVALVRLPAGRVEDFRTAVAPLADEGVLEVTVRPAREEGDTTLDAAAPAARVEVVGADRPGIVHEVAEQLVGLGVGIVELRTWTEPAPMAGGALFRAVADVQLPDGVSRGRLVAALEALPDNLMVDLAEV